MFPIGRFELLAVVIVALSAFALAWLFGRFTSSSKRRATLFSALPLPAFGLLLSAWVIFDAATASAEECGVDACGMAVAAGVAVIVMSILALVLALFSASLGFRLGRR